MRELGQGTRGRKYNNGFDGWVDLTNARINLTFSYPYIYIYIFPKNIDIFNHEVNFF